MASGRRYSEELVVRVKVGHEGTEEGGQVKHGTERGGSGGVGKKGPSTKLERMTDAPEPPLGIDPSFRGT